MLYEVITVLAIIVGVVIIGGIKRIGKVTEKLVPAMAVFYVIGALVIIVLHIDQLPAAFVLIFSHAFARITSYNVCYTKLLRAAAGRTPQEHNGIGIPNSAALTTELNFPVPRWSATKEGLRKTLSSPPTSRITSYNVCYTKLLRSAKSKDDV